MAIPVWPSKLPQKPMRDDFSEEFADGRKFQPMQAGPAKVRRAFSSAVEPLDLSFVVTANLLLVFKQFWKVDTRGGSLPFLLPDPIFHGQPLTNEAGETIVDQLGRPITVSSWLLVMFGESRPRTTPYGGREFRVSAEISVMP